MNMLADVEVLDLLKTQFSAEKGLDRFGHPLENQLYYVRDLDEKSVSNVETLLEVKNWYFIAKYSPVREVFYFPDDKEIPLSSAKDAIPIYDVLQTATLIETTRGLDKLIESEGSSVTVLCSNPDPATIEETEGIVVISEKTAWQEKVYTGVALLGAVRKALADLVALADLGE